MQLKFLVAVILLLGCGGVTAFAQQPGVDPIGDNLFAPEFVMGHQQALGLTEEQKAFFKTGVRKAQTIFTELQWQLQDEMEKLVAQVSPAQVNEAQTLEQLDKVLNLEREIKKAQIALLVRIKNNLTPDQQARLRDIRARK